MRETCVKSPGILPLSHSGPSLHHHHLPLKYFFPHLGDPVPHHTNSGPNHSPLDELVGVVLLSSFLVLQTATKNPN